VDFSKLYHRENGGEAWGDTKREGNQGGKTPGKMPPETLFKKHTGPIERDLLKAHGIHPGFENRRKSRFYPGPLKRLRKN